MAAQANTDQTTQAGDNLGPVGDIVAAYVGHNTIAVSELPALIASVHKAVSGLSKAVEEASAPPPEPAVPIRSSVRADSVACLECGKRFRSLKRHLRTHHAMTPDEYRARWDLKRDYPVVAPDYAAARSALAKRLGLGRKQGRS